MLASARLVSRDSGRFFFPASRGVTATVVLGLALSAARRVEATPSGLFGAGPHSVALAGGGTSLALGPESVLLNPGALAEQREKTLVFGLRASAMSLSLEYGGGSKPFPAELTKALLIGVAAPLIAPSPDGWRAALGVYAETPPDFLVRTHLPLGGEASFPLLVGRAGALDLGVALGVGYGRFSFGAGVEVLAALSGRDVVAGTGGSTAGVGDELLPAWGPGVGLTADLGAVGRLGVAVRSVLRADFDVDVAAANIGGLIGIAPLNVEGIAHYEPLKVDLELSHPIDSWTLLAGARYERWSALPSFAGRTVECPTGVSCGTPVPQGPDYSDVVVPRLGVERTFPGERVQLTARAGYSFVPSPAPEQRSVTNGFDATRHAFAAGYRLRIARDALPLELEAGLRFDWLAPRTHHKSGADATGPFGAEITTSGHLLTWALGARLEL
jgi:hypothetical protein